MELSPFLFFKNQDFEKEFVRFYGFETKLFLRGGLISSLVCWTFALIAAYFVSHDNFIKILSVILISAYPLFITVIISTFYDRFVIHYQWMAGFCNLIAAFLALYLRDLYSSNLFILVTLIIIVFFSVIALRLRVSYAIAVTLIYVGYYQYLIVYSYHYEPNEVIYHSFSIWIAEFAAIFSSYVLEYDTRKLFIQSKIIEQQKKQIQLEREKSESLLLNILPHSIAERLKSGETLIADNYSDVSVLFADIVNFTTFSNQKDPGVIVEILNDVFSTFDDLSEKYNLEKIKTIGDAYMVVAGLPIPRKDHAEVIANMALDMKAIIKKFTDQYGLNIRIGISSGPVVAGIIGKRKFLYDLWGDTVNTASRMESQGKSGEIHVSTETYDLLKHKYRFDYLGLVDIKGKGQVKTYLLKDVITTV